MISVFVLIVCQIVAGLLYGNFVEWMAHKYFLHDLGKKPKSIFAFHWYEHHRKSTIYKFRDSDYDKPIWNWNSRGKEIIGLFLLWLIHSWLFFVLPIFFITVTYCVFNYYFTHKWAHQNPEWAKKHLRWHWEHHQMKNQDANFCVTQPWFDYIFGTRIHYREITTKKKTQKFVPVRESVFW